MDFIAECRWQKQVNKLETRSTEIIQYGEQKIQNWKKYKQKQKHNIEKIELHGLVRQYEKAWYIQNCSHSNRQENKTEKKNLNKNIENIQSLIKI